MTQQLKIGSVALGNPTILAPMAGITNLPFRLISKKNGCALVCSEMISANGLVYGSKKTFQLLHSTPEEKPLSVQIFGSNPGKMAEAAQIVEAYGSDIIDINFGCSVKKIVKSGSGAALMKNPHQAEAILKAVRNAVTIPLTIKIRSGWDSSGKQAIELSQIAEACGADAITIHPRTAKQGFTGKSDWSMISRIKQTVSIPVIGNGDVLSHTDAMEMKTLTGCDGIMIGRASIDNPWIFRQITNYFNDSPISDIDLTSRFALMIEYLKRSIQYFGEEHGCRMMRSRLGWFTKGLHSSSSFRESIKQMASENEAIALIRLYMDKLMKATDLPD